MRTCGAHLTRIARLELVAILSGLPIALAACDDGDTGVGPGDTSAIAEESFSWQFPVRKQTALSLSGVNGDVEITAGSPFRVEGVRRVGSFSEADARANLDRLVVAVADLGDEIRIETRQPEKDFRSYSVDYVITVPDGIVLTIVNVNGGVAVGPRAGSASIVVVNGFILADTSVPADGFQSLSTVNGGIDLAIPASTSAVVSATVVNGSIVVQDLPLATSVSTGTKLVGTLGAGDSDISLSTVNGAILLHRSP